MSPKRAHVTVKGTVQGVAYRWSTQEQARALGVSGWVRNLNSGDVEVLAEGPVDAVDALVTWCRRGPPAAQVEKMDVEELPATGEFTSFAIRR